MGDISSECILFKKLSQPSIKSYTLLYIEYYSLIGSYFVLDGSTFTKPHSSNKSRILSLTSLGHLLT